ncbi:MAG: hypothetical protein ACRDOK_12265 [Streptosporangiaceae bacterium]
MLAPPAALLVAQVTLYQTVRSKIQRAAAVLAGVLVAVAISIFVGLAGRAWHHDRGQDDRRLQDRVCVRRHLGQFATACAWTETPLVRRGLSPCV